MAMYRNPTLLALANECGQCMRCGYRQAGAIVAAHSNKQRHGKGTGLKANDIAIAFLCDICHSLIDGRSGDMTQRDRDSWWHEACVDTLVWVAVNRPDVLKAGKLCRE